MLDLLKRRLFKPGDGNTIAQNFASQHLLKLVLAISLFGTHALAQTLTVIPQNPIAGDTINIVYDAKGGKFEKDTLKSVTVIVFEGLMQDNKKLPLTREGNVYKAKLPTDSSTLMIALAFGLNKVWDNSPLEGHFYPFYKNGKMVEGARYVISDFYTNPTGKALYGFNNDHQKVVKILKDEMDQYPDGVYKVRTLEKYYQSLYQIDRVKGRAEILAYIANIDKQKQLTDLDYYKKYRLYVVLGMTKAADECIEMITVKFPSSPVIFAKRYKDALTPQTAQRMELLGNKLINDYNMKTDQSFKSFLGGVYSAISRAYLKEYNFERFYHYLLETEQGLRSLNLADAAEFLAMAKQGSAEAERIAKWNISLVDSLLAQSDLKKAAYLKERKIDGEGALGQIYYHQKKYDAAFSYLKKAHEENKDASIQATFYYALLLMKNGDSQQAKLLLEMVIRKGKIGEEVLSAYQEAYLKANGRQESYKEDLTKLLAAAKTGRREELTKMMINMPAPGFSLVDLKGKKVSLSDYAGKIVVLDFWATWCIPCLQAFPGMQQLINKYEADKNIVFLFINTAESTSNDRSKNINAYLKKNNFNFKVLLDEKQQGNKDYYAQTQYGAQAIPLKVVVDQKGNIRFRSVGYLGSDEKVVEEISEFIEMLK